MAEATKKSLLVIGECMMELSGEGQNYHRTFAGDTYNSAVYAKRRYDEIDVQILTVIGSDPISEAMVAQWRRDKVGHSLVMTSAVAHPGIYAITTDDKGERSFTYWRKDSAATELMSLITEDIRRKIAQFDVIFFSGISLAILSDGDKTTFLSLMATLKKQGKTVAFDPNYRPFLWRTTSHPTHWLTEAYRIADIALPGLADHKELFGHQSSEDVSKFLQKELQIHEVVVKADSAGIFGYKPDQAPVHLAVTSEPNPLDTTGAGDSFAGTYLAERLMGVPMADAMQSAAKIASLVVQHRGAIVDEARYRDFVQEVF